MRKLITLLCLFGLGACALPDRAYLIDGVPVVLERNHGPKRKHMKAAVMTYREAARARFDLTEDADQQTWRQLAEIRWTAAKLNDHVLLDDDGTLWANWYGCALDVPFYQALTLHYVDASDDDIDWAYGLEQDSEATVCVTEPGWQVPGLAL